MNHIFEPKLFWRSTRDDIIEAFYKPALKNCLLYQRLSAYFSSTTFANIAEEILDFIESDGRIQLITSSHLSQNDKDLFERSVDERDRIVSNVFLEDLKREPALCLEFSKIMAYMLTNMIDKKPQLEIKIAIPKNKFGLYHQKIGIMKYGNGERITFVGSVNETGMGWRENVENFSAYRSWGDDTNMEGVVSCQANFNDLWNNNDENVMVYDLPTAIKQHFLKIRPESDFEMRKIVENLRNLIHKNDQREQPIQLESEIQLQNHQRDAVRKWLDNDCRGILEMATGTGKTFTAFSCMGVVQKRNERTITVIACPQKHLVEQWKTEIKRWNNGVDADQRIELDYSVTCDSDNPNWKTELGQFMDNFSIMPLGYKSYITNHLIIFTTHDTLQKQSLRNKLLDAKNAKILLIIDEVHNVTVKSSQNMLLEEFNFRLGLSATPVRHTDDEGTAVLQSYFNGIVYTLNLSDAIYKLGILCQYNYLPHYVELTEDEMGEYRRQSAKIAQIESMKKSTHRPPSNMSDPYLKRANLIANAENKDGVLGYILDELNNNLDKTLIYCTNNPSPLSSKNSPRQLERVKKILTGRGIDSDSVTWEDKTKDRLHILNLMEQGHFDCVTAVRCLDEGVDVPSVDMGIFMASSGNPKQFIQRRGRILRKSDKTGKKIATIYDILVTPPIPNEDVEFNLSERKLIAKELLRHKEFASIARNKNQAMDKIRGIADLFGIDIALLDYDYIRNMVSDD